MSFSVSGATVAPSPAYLLRADAPSTPARFAALRTVHGSLWRTGVRLIHALRGHSAWHWPRGAVLGVSFFSLALILTGCGDTFTPASVVENTRFVGVGVEALGEEGEEDADGEAPSATRAWPRPEELTRLTSYFATPSGGQETVSFAFVVCPDFAVPSGPGQCAGEPFAAFVQQDPVTGVPEVELPVPPLADFPDEPRIRIIGIICPRASLNLPEGFDGGNLDAFDTDTLDASCMPPEGETTTFFTFSIPLDIGEGTNRNPRFLPEALSLNDELWPENPNDSPEDPLSDCTEAGTPELPRVSALDETATVFMTFPEEDREPYQENRDGEIVELTEALQVSTLTTRGEIARFTFVDENNPEGNDAEWEAPEPENVDPNGEVVHLTFVVRDGRGGLDQTRRTLCVFP